MLIIINYMQTRVAIKCLSIHNQYSLVSKRYKGNHKMPFGVAICICVQEASTVELRRPKKHITGIEVNLRLISTYLPFGTPYGAHCLNFDFIGLANLL